MFEDTRTQARIGWFAWVMAWFGLGLGQLHALARFATEEGRSDLEAGVVRAWAEPAAGFLSPLLTWASPDTVYVTYGKLWLPVFIAFTLCALVVHRRRGAVDFRGAERWAWRVALTGYVAACAGVAGEYWTQWGNGNQALLDAVFAAVIPVMLVTLVGSTFLGVVLIRRGLGLPAWLLASALPAMFVISTVTSLGNVVLPIAFCFGLLGRRLAATLTHSTAAPAVPAGRV